MGSGVGVGVGMGRIRISPAMGAYSEKSCGHHGGDLGFIGERMLVPLPVPPTPSKAYGGALGEELRCAEKSAGVRVCVWVWIRIRVSRTKKA